ncbi:Rieske (2Fe-2S) protein [Ignavibacterium sp.]|jgi:Rieske Fe-S protein|uniref:QcrA and Rieske domain-containing protein n=1 Tax=Ignavibacterium sp. TaxID=2651167 RepID=UPI0025BC8BDF|nr:Rieske (2Fe-2S) protein [Ignavibacterium sp.]
MKQDFYTDTKTNRRDFLNYILSISGLGFIVSVLYPIIAYLKPPRQSEVEVSNVLACKLSELEKESYKIIRFGNKPVILIRTVEDKLVAFSATCTHLDCTVQYRKDFGTIWCACHNGKYDLTGRNISGPPPKPLDKYKVILKCEDIYISKMA